MIAGIAVTAGVAGSLLDPFSPARLVAVTGGVVRVSPSSLTLLAVWGVESAAAMPPPARRQAPRRRSCEALAQVWAEPQARRFTIFVFVSMLAYSAQDLILEPFAGLVFGLTPGESTKLSGVQHGGVLLGMIAVALAGSFGRGRLGSLRAWTVGGCLASAVTLAGLAAAGFVGPSWPLRADRVRPRHRQRRLRRRRHRLDDGAGRHAAARRARACAWACGVRRRRSPSASAASPARSRPTSPASLIEFARHRLRAPCSRARRSLFLVSAVLAARVGGTAPRAPDRSPTAGARYAAGLGGR